MICICKKKKLQPEKRAGERESTKEVIPHPFFLIYVAIPESWFCIFLWQWNSRSRPRYKAKILELGSIVRSTVHGQVDFGTFFWQNLKLLQNTRQIQENLDRGCCLRNTGSLACRDDQIKKKSMPFSIDIIHITRAPVTATWNKCLHSGVVVHLLLRLNTAC